METKGFELSRRETREIPSHAILVLDLRTTLQTSTRFKDTLQYEHIFTPQTLIGSRTHLQARHLHKQDSS